MAGRSKVGDFVFSLVQIFLHNKAHSEMVIIGSINYQSIKLYKFHLQQFAAVDSGHQ